MGRVIGAAKRATTAERSDREGFGREFKAAFVSVPTARRRAPSGGIRARGVSLANRAPGNTTRRSSSETILGGCQRARKRPRKPWHFAHDTEMLFRYQDRTERIPRSAKALQYCPAPTRWRGFFAAQQRDRREKATAENPTGTKLSAARERLDAVTAAVLRGRCLRCRWRGDEIFNAADREIIGQFAKAASSATSDQSPACSPPEPTSRTGSFIGARPVGGR